MLPIGIQPARALDQPRQQRAFRQGKLLHVFTKVCLGGLAESIDRKAATLAQRNLVGINLEDLLLGEAMLQLEGNDDL